MAKKVFFKEYETSVTTQDNVNAIQFVLANTNANPFDTEEHYNLIALAKQGNEKARTNIMQAYMRLVVSIARNYQYATIGTTISVGDMIDEGCIGIGFAIENFDKEKGNFSNIAAAYIRREITAFINDHISAVRTPHNTQRTYGDSLDEQIGDEDTTKADMLSNPNDKADHTDIKSLAKDIARVMATILTNKEINIICNAFGIGTTQKSNWEIADELGMCEERVRQIKVEAISKMKQNAKALNLLQKYL